MQKSDAMQSKCILNHMNLQSNKLIDFAVWDFAVYNTKYDFSVQDFAV